MQQYLYCLAFTNHLPKVRITAKLKSSHSRVYWRRTGWSLKDKMRKVSKTKAFSSKRIKVLLHDAELSSPLLTSQSNLLDYILKPLQKLSTEKSFSFIVLFPTYLTALTFTTFQRATIAGCTRQKNFQADSYTANTKVRPWLPNPICQI